MADKNASLGVCMIVKNEEAVLDRCLEHIGDFADELIIVDTGSDDATKEIAARYTDRIFDFPWCDDFAAARNYAFSKAAADYIMWLDADCSLNEHGIEKLKQLKTRLSGYASVIMPRRSPETEGIPVPMLRIMKRGDGRAWEGAVHERYPVFGPVLYADIEVLHEPAADGGAHRNARLVHKLTEEEFRKNFWLYPQVICDLILAGESAKAEEYRRKMDEAAVPLRTMLRPYLTAAAVMSYHGKTDEAFSWFDRLTALLTPETEERNVEILFDRAISTALRYNRKDKAAEYLRLRLLTNNR